VSIRNVKFIMPALTYAGSLSIVQLHNSSIIFLNVFERSFYYYNL